MKKVIVQIMCVVLTLGILTTGVLAAPEAWSINYSGFKSLFSILEGAVDDNTIVDRIDMFNLLRPYMETDTGIDSLLSFVEDPTILPVAIEGIEDYIVDYKSEALFALSFIRSLNENDRKEAFKNMKSRTDYATFTGDYKTALDAMYIDYVTPAMIAALEADHGLTAPIFFNLIAMIKGTFVTTDLAANNAKIELMSIDPAFSAKLETNLAKYFTTVNGAATTSGGAVMATIIDALNSATNTQIHNYKTLFKFLGMYEARQVQDTTPSRPSGGTSSLWAPGGIRTELMPDTGVNTNQPPVIAAPVIGQPELEAIEGMADVNDEWFVPYVATLVSKGIFKGYEDGSFRPNQGITRGEIAVSMVRVLGLEARLETAGDAPYADFDLIPDWANKSITLLSELNILLGYGDGTFQSGNVITREEFTAILERASNIAETNIELAFADKDDIYYWAVESVRKVSSVGIVRGYEDNTFRPKNFVTRAEVATMLYNFMHFENLL